MNQVEWFWVAPAEHLNFLGMGSRLFHTKSEAEEFKKSCNHEMRIEGRHYQAKRDS